MATVEPKSLYAVSPAEPENAYFTVALVTTGYLDTETVNAVSYTHLTLPTTD